MALQCSKVISFQSRRKIIWQKFIHKHATQIDYTKYYEVLGLENEADQERVRIAFINLAKRFHPDSKNAEADEKKFNEIESAYRVLQTKFSNERWGINEGEGEYGLYYEDKAAQEFDIEHTAPQHRQYLSHEGYGSGSPSQRERQYQKYRVITAAENVLNHQIAKHVAESKEDALVVKDKKESKKIKTRYGMERLVEDLIQQSMAKGEFDNLSCKGKPLPPRAADNPYVDFVTHKMNQVLIDNGFAPEWITLQKEILREIEDIKIELLKDRQCVGTEPLSPEDLSLWNQHLEKYNSRVNHLNSKINKFNLLVPLLRKQMLFMHLQKEAARALKEGKTKHDLPSRKQETLPKATEEDSTLMGMLCSMLHWK